MSTKKTLAPLRIARRADGADKIKKGLWVVASEVALAVHDVVAALGMAPSGECRLGSADLPIVGRTTTYPRCWKRIDLSS